MLVLLYYLYDVKTNRDKLQPKINAISHTFFGVFFCYPTICIVSFATFICRQITPTVSVLDADDTVICEDPTHVTLQTISGFVIVLVACGLPLLFAVVLIRSASKYQRETGQQHKVLARQVAKDMDVPVETARWVIRDVTIGRDFSFLMDAYTPQYLYWYRPAIRYRSRYFMPFGRFSRLIEDCGCFQGGPRHAA